MMDRRMPIRPRSSSGLRQTRIGVFRHSATPRATAFNTCIERAVGTWVHVLHGDDVVQPGFYTAIRTAHRVAPVLDGGRGRS